MLKENKDTNKSNLIPAFKPIVIDPVAIGTSGEN